MGLSEGLHEDFSTFLFSQRVKNPKSQLWRFDDLIKIMSPFEMSNFELKVNLWDMLHVC
jgi:hypothetical protein